MEQATFDTGASARVLVAGEGDLAAAVARDLEAAGSETEWLHRPTDSEFSAGLARGPHAVVVVTRDDPRALRLALLASYELPKARLVVTIFDRTVATQLRSAVSGCIVVSMADLVAASLAGPCLDEDLAALRRGSDGLQTVHFVDGDVTIGRHRREPVMALRRACDTLLGTALPFEGSARILVLGLAGLLLTLTVDVLVALIPLHESFVTSLFLGVRTLVTVGPNDAVAGAGTGVRLLAILTMLGALASAAVFTAGLVSRLLEDRRVAIVGRRAMPRRGHVVVVGMGQVGLRLALLLRDAGVPVVGVERNPQALGVRLGRRYGLPVVIADGGDRDLMDRLSLRRVRALAAVTSDDLTNVAIALAARAVRTDLRVVLRAGDGEVAAETRSLLRLGAVCDAHRLSGIGLAAAALGWQPGDVVLDAAGDATLIDIDGRTQRLRASPFG